MAKINAKIFALKHTLFKTLENSLKSDKEAIKNGVEIAHKDYCKIQVVDCEKSILDEAKVLELCDKYGVDITTLKKTTHYQKVDVKNVPTEVNNKVENIFNMLEDSNDKIISKVANMMIDKVASKK